MGIGYNSAHFSYLSISKGVFANTWSSYASKLVLCQQRACLPKNSKQSLCYHKGLTPTNAPKTFTKDSGYLEISRKTFTHLLNTGVYFRCFQRKYLQ